MILVVWSAVTLIFFFITVVNYYYQKVKYKYSPAEEIKRLPLFESPSTWRILLAVSLVVLIGTFAVCGKYMADGLSAVGQQQNAADQLLQDPASRNTDDRGSSDSGRNAGGGQGGGQGGQN